MRCCPEAVCGGVGRGKSVLQTGTTRSRVVSALIGVTSDGAENAPRLRVANGEDSKESKPPVKRRVETHTANVQGSSAPVPWRWGSRTGNRRLQGTEAVVTVEDTGIGIPAEALPRLFEMFSQVDRNLDRAQGGLGIGLALVKGLTESHGGTVKVFSAGVGKGSSFVVRLPVSPGVPVREKQSPTDGAAFGPRRRILVVDDNRDGASSLAMLLAVMGHDTRIAHDGLEGVKLAEAFRPDLIVLDIGLPKLNGLDACRRIRQQPWAKNVVIAAATGWGQDEDRRRSEEAGFDHHLVKPVDAAALGTLVANGSREKRLHQGPRPAR